jgi:hypothetical protein
LCCSLLQMQHQMTCVALLISLFTVFHRQLHVPNLCVTASPPSFLPPSKDEIERAHIVRAAAPACRHPVGLELSAPRAFFFVDPRSLISSLIPPPLPLSSASSISSHVPPYSSSPTLPPRGVLAI